MSVFKDKTDLIRFAEAFLEERKSSLLNDVNKCLKKSCFTKPAPFSALVYCFSVIDLMGALLSGEATKDAKTSQIASDYMLHFMNYTKDEIEMLQNVFRHKIVHLSQPHFVGKNNSGDKIAWREYHDNRKEHLKIETGLTEQDIQAPAGIPINLLIKPIRYNATFTVSIKSLAEGICKSIDNYISALEKDATLQKNFDKAIEVITGV